MQVIVRNYELSNTTELRKEDLRNYFLDWYWGVIGTKKQRNSMDELNNSN